MKAKLKIILSSQDSDIFDSHQVMVVYIFFERRSLSKFSGKTTGEESGGAGWGRGAGTKRGKKHVNLANLYYLQIESFLGLCPMHHLPQITEGRSDALAQRGCPGTLLPCCMMGLGRVCRQHLSLGLFKLGVRMTTEFLS